MQDIVEALEDTAARGRWREVLELFDRRLRGDETTLPNDAPGSQRGRALEAVFQAHLALGDYGACEQTLRRFETCAVTDGTIRRSNALFDAHWRRLGKRIVGTTYVGDGSVREPTADEVVVYYGSFPYDHRALPWGVRVHRHAHFAADLRHDVFESDAAAWGRIGIIYVLNLSERRDRYYDTLLELCRVHAPLDRVHQFRVEREHLVPRNDYVNASACCATNHARMMRHFLATRHDYCVVLEDDIAFASDGERVRADLATFFARPYAFAVCLLAASKYHDLRPHDDLLLRSHQECTTAAAYVVPRASAPLLLECFETGAAEIVRTGDVQQFAADRYWARLMADHPFYTFRRKIAYQKPSWSSIQSRHVYNFD